MTGWETSLTLLKLISRLALACIAFCFGLPLVIIWGLVRVWEGIKAG